MVQPYFSSARCNPSDRLNRHGRGGCSYVERQKPGNDFDKVTERPRPTTPPHQEGTTDSECLSLRTPESLYRQHSDTRSTRFSVPVQKLTSVCQLGASWGCRERRFRGGEGGEGGAARHGALVSRIYEKHTPRRRRLLPFT